jgi:hypothetical protein
MVRSKSSSCDRFVVLDGLHIDRTMFEELQLWAGENRLHIQDAIQLALCVLVESASCGSVLARSASVGRDELTTRGPRTVH